MNAISMLISGFWLLLPSASYGSLQVFPYLNRCISAVYASSEKSAEEFWQSVEALSLEEREQLNTTLRYLINDLIDSKSDIDLPVKQKEALFRQVFGKGNWEALFEHLKLSRRAAELAAEERKPPLFTGEKPKAGGQKSGLNPNPSEVSFADIYQFDATLDQKYTSLNANINWWRNLIGSRNSSQEEVTFAGLLAKIEAFLISERFEEIPAIRVEKQPGLSLPGSRISDIREVFSSAESARVRYLYAKATIELTESLEKDRNHQLDSAKLEEMRTKSLQELEEVRPILARTYFFYLQTLTYLHSELVSKSCSIRCKAGILRMLGAMGIHDLSHRIARDALEQLETQVIERRETSPQTKEAWEKYEKTLIRSLVMTGAGMKEIGEDPKIYELILNKKLSRQRRGALALLLTSNAVTRVLYALTNTIGASTSFLFRWAIRGQMDNRARYYHVGPLQVLSRAQSSIRQKLVYLNMLAVDDPTILVTLYRHAPFRLLAEKFEELFTEEGSRQNTLYPMLKQDLGEAKARARRMGDLNIALDQSTLRKVGSAFLSASLVAIVIAKGAGVDVTSLTNILDIPATQVSTELDQASQPLQKVFQDNPELQMDVIEAFSAAEHGLSDP